MPVDGHCHLDCLQFRENVEGVVARAAAAGVGGRVSVRTRPSRFDHTRRIEERHASVRFAVGLHPCHVGEQPAPTVEDLLQFATHPRMAGIQSRNAPPGPQKAASSIWPRTSGSETPTPTGKAALAMRIPNRPAGGDPMRAPRSSTLSRATPSATAGSRRFVAPSWNSISCLSSPSASSCPSAPASAASRSSAVAASGPSGQDQRPAARQDARPEQDSGCARGKAARTSADAHRTAVSDRSRIDAPARPTARTPATFPRFERRVRMTPRLPCAMIVPGAWSAPHPTPIE